MYLMDMKTTITIKRFILKALMMETAIPLKAFMFIKSKMI